MASQTLGRVFLRRFWCCIKIIFPSLLSSTFLLFVLLLGLSMAEQILIYNTGLIPSEFYEILSSKDKRGFQSFVIIVACTIGGSALAQTLVQYVSNVSYVLWRSLLSRFLHKGYFRNEMYYHVNVLDRRIDNPDQRITQDTERFCRQFRKIMSSLIISPFTIAYYTYQCYISTGYLGPTCVFGYFIIGAMINKLIVSQIIGLVVQQEKMEGNFRFKHMQVRVNSESLAYYKACAVEQSKANKKLQSLIDVQQRIVNCEFFLNLSVNIFSYFGAILSYVVIGIAIFAGRYDELSTGDLTSEISKSAFVMMYLMSCFTNVIALSNSFMDMAGYAHRIGELLEHLEEKELNSRNTHHALSSGRLGAEKNWMFKLQSVTYGAPKSTNPLVSNLDLVISTGENILITGRGKSSLLRVLSGLWEPTSGVVQRAMEHNPCNVICLTQKPLIVVGSLKDNVTYPHVSVTLQQQNDKEIASILGDVDLVSICDRVGGINVDMDVKWGNMLSPGEMQRLSFARLFYHMPVIAFLDEATSAMDKQSERVMYQKCCQLGITLVSVGHKETLMEYHQMHLHLDGQGGWILDRLH